MTGVEQAKRVIGIKDDTRSVALLQGMRSALLFVLLYEEWEAAEDAAERAWTEVWKQIALGAGGIGTGPSDSDLARAAQLGCEASELFVALRQILSQSRRQVRQD